MTTYTPVTHHDTRHPIPQRHSPPRGAKGVGDTATVLAEKRTTLADARSHMANERTHLAYLRTSVSLMSFGITLNRFSIYLIEQQRMPESHSRLHGAETIGLGMVIVGILLLLWSLYRYRQVNDEIETLTFKPPNRSVTVLTLAIILLGAVTTAWMMLS